MISTLGTPPRVTTLPTRRQARDRTKGSPVIAKMAVGVATMPLPGQRTDTARGQQAADQEVEVAQAKQDGGRADQRVRRPA